MSWLIFDYSYLLMVLPAVLFSVWCQALVQKRFRQYAAVPVRSRVTGARTAEMVCVRNEARHTRIEPVRGLLRDHFDPRQNVIRLSENVYGASSVAAVGIAAHEAGHAAQYSGGYPFLRLRGALIPLSQIGANVAMPLVFAGLVFSYDPLITIGILCFSVAAFVQLITLPVEFGASHTALRTLESEGILTEEELRGAAKVLRAAALTYVAAMAVALVQLLRLILLSQSRRNR